MDKSVQKDFVHKTAWFQNCCIINQQYTNITVPKPLHQLMRLMQPTLGSELALHRQVAVTSTVTLSVSEIMEVYS